MVRWQFIVVSAKKPQPLCSFKSGLCILNAILGLLKIRICKKIWIRVSHWSRNVPSGAMDEYFAGKAVGGWMQSKKRILMGTLTPFGEWKNQILRIVSYGKRWWIDCPPYLQDGMPRIQWYTKPHQLFWYSHLVDDHNNFGLHHQVLTRCGIQLVGNAGSFVVCNHQG